MDSKYSSSEQTVEAEVIDSSVIDEGVLRKVLIQAGRIVARPAIEALEMVLDNSTPAQARLTMLAGLTYLIFPLDIVPDLIPVIGFSDDLVALTAIISIWKHHMTPQIQTRARQKLDKWLPL